MLGLSYLREWLWPAPTLESLMERESLSDADRVRLSELLSRETTLRIKKASPAGLSALCGSLRENRTVRSLSLSSCDINDTGVANVADMLGTSCALCELVLLNNQLSASGAHMLAVALRGNTSLRRIDLGLNSIGAEGAKHLLDALHTNTTLSHIGLGASNLRTEGARCVAETLRVSISLRQLDLSCNGIGDQGAKHLAHALTANSSLRYLHIGHNHLTAVGARYLAEALSMNSALREIGIDGCSEGVACIADAVRHRSPPLSIQGFSRVEIESLVIRAQQLLASQRRARLRVLAWSVARRAAGRARRL